MDFVQTAGGVGDHVGAEVLANGAAAGQRHLHGLQEDAVAARRVVQVQVRLTQAQQELPGVLAENLLVRGHGNERTGR